MSRVKRGVTARRHHKKILEATSGHKGQRHRLFRRANESLLHAMEYSTRDRYDRKGQFRRLWITRINAAARQEGMSYSELINGLSKAEVEVNRKMLAEIAVSDPEGFRRFVEIAREGAAA